MEYKVKIYIGGGAECVTGETGEKVEEEWCFL